MCIVARKSSCVREVEKLKKNREERRQVSHNVSYLVVVLFAVACFCGMVSAGGL